MIAKDIECAKSRAWAQKRILELREQIRNLMGTAISGHEGCGPCYGAAPIPENMKALSQAIWARPYEDVVFVVDHQRAYYVSEFLNKHFDTYKRHIDKERIKTQERINLEDRLRKAEKHLAALRKENKKLKFPPKKKRY